MGSAFLSRKVGLAALMFLWIASLLCTAVVAGAGDLTIGNYELVGSKRIDRTTWEYTYRATAVNGDGALRSAVAATVSTTPASAVVVDGSLWFGDIVPGGTAKSVDTFTLRVDRTKPFQNADLSWRFSYLEASPGSGGYVKPTNDSKLKVDPDTGLQVIVDQLIIVFKEDVAIDRAKQKIAAMGGNIVGYLGGYNIYQVEIIGALDLDIVKGLVEQLNNDAEVEVAKLHGIVSPLFYPNDPKWEDSWDEAAPKGKNWGLEAIYAPSAWDALGYPAKSHLAPKIGIVDGGFNITHPDLKIARDHAFGSDGRYEVLPADGHPAQDSLS